MTRNLPAWTRNPGVRITLILLLVVLLINGAALWGIFSSGRNARQAALHELQLQTLLQAGALEASLASIRGDFIFLSQSPPVSNTYPILSVEDPLMRRWGRLDVEGSLLLYMQAHPEVEGVRVRAPDGTVLIATGRRDGAPVLLPPDSAPELPTGQDLLSGSWPLGPVEQERGTLEAAFDLEALLRTVAPGAVANLSLETGFFTESAETRQEGDTLLVRVPVRDDGWDPPIRWTLLRRETESHVLESLTDLAARYRTTLLLNLLVMSLALILGLLAFRQVRRSLALAEENRQQVRIRELERRVMHNERLAGLGRLAGGIAHEINNPLEGMSNYLSLLEDDLRERKDREALKLTERIREGLERAAGIVRQVLTFSDPGEAPHEVLDLGKVVRETVDFVRGNPSFRQVRVRLEGDHVPLAVRGNRVTLGQLFLNLLLNACQVQPRGGDVEVALRRKGDGVEVTVADRGPGFSAEERDRLFEPFYSGRGSTGLGLSVCHGIAGHHGGEILAENRPGGGAVFFVLLPLIPEEPSLGEGPPKSPRVAEVRRESA